LWCDILWRDTLWHGTDPASIPRTHPRNRIKVPGGRASSHGVNADAAGDIPVRVPIQLVSRR